MLVYWPLEGSVTSVDSTAVSGGNDIGSNCNVTTKDETLEGRIAAKGTKQHLWNKYTPNKLSLQQELN